MTAADNAQLPASDPAWGERARGEPRWPASLAIIAAFALYGLLPPTLTLQAMQDALGLGLGQEWLRWVLPALEVALLVTLTIAEPRRRAGEPRWLRYGAVAIIALVNIANIVSLFLLVRILLHPQVLHLKPGQQLTGEQLLIPSINVWLTNVLVFALWYWELDRGGPDDRSRPVHRRPDFLFPQMTTPHCTRERWTPSFMDYLYVSFTNATAFSPTDTMPLTPWAKTLMTVQALASLLTVALVAARAINILGQQTGA